MLPKPNSVNDSNSDSNDLHTAGRPIAIRDTNIEEAHDRLRLAMHEKK